tara:strand:- start:147 stop:338 length:192 start_codon:yes stop_codon:yes gene_type:complete
MTSTFKIIKRNYGVEFNNGKPSNSYKTKQDAVNAGNSWMRDCTYHAELRKGWNYEVVEVLKCQ